MNNHNTPTPPEDTASSILSPITTHLKNSKLTLSRLCKDLNQVIKTTKDNPNAKLKGIDMALKLHGKDAYPVDKLEIEHSGSTEMALAVTVYRRELENTVPSIEEGEHEDTKQGTDTG